jgi:hypothetical protein
MHEELLKAPNALEELQVEFIGQHIVSGKSHHFRNVFMLGAIIETR